MTYRIGDEYVWLGETGHSYTAGKRYAIEAIFDDELRVNDDRGGNHQWCVDAFEKHFRPVSGVSGFTADELQRVSDVVIDDVTQKLYGDDPNRVTKKSVLEAAIQTVADRGVPYGGVEDNFNRIASLWQAHLENRYASPDFAAFPVVDAADVAMMMALMKIARLEANPSHADSWIDVAGYAACGGEIGAKLTLDKSE